MQIIKIFKFCKKSDRLDTNMKKYVILIKLRLSVKVTLINLDCNKNLTNPKK